MHHHLHHVYDAENGDGRVLIGAEADLEEKRSALPPPVALPSPGALIGAKTKSALLRTEIPGPLEKGAERVPNYAKKVEAAQDMYAKGHKANLQELKKNKPQPRKLAW